MRPLAAGAAVAMALLVAADARRTRSPALLVAKVPIALRVAPDGGAPMRATLAAGEAFEIKVRQGHWAQVRSGERWGWAIEADIRELSEESGD